jgi:hypothetical protein
MEFYGAMDGAGKFVRGDAVAGLIITGINIVGGLLMGMVYRNLTSAQAFEKYTILTIGDGLVAQIPALLVSTAAGILVTKGASETGARPGDGRPDARQRPRDAPRRRRAGADGAAARHADGAVRDHRRGAVRVLEHGRRARQRIAQRPQAPRQPRPKPEGDDTQPRSRTCSPSTASASRSATA